MLRVTSPSRTLPLVCVAVLSLGVLVGCDFSSLDQSGSKANLEGFNTTDVSGAATHGMNIANRALRMSAPSNLRSKSRTSAQTEEAIARTLDRELAYISEVVPGFGGMYLEDETGIMHIYVENPGSGNGPSEEVITAIQSASPKAQFSALAKLQVYSDRGRIEVHDGEYSFDRLAEWKQDAMVLFEGSSPVLSIDANEGENRVVIGVETAMVPDRLRNKLAQIGIPEGAVKFETNQGPVTSLKGLRDKFRPLRGGIQIKNASGGICTLGWDVHFQVDGQSIPGFITNSHCTTNRTSVTGMAFYQGGNQVGTEVYEAKETQNVQDPPHYFNYDSCPSGHTCFFADAAGIQYDNEVAGQRKIAQTKDWWNQSLTVDPDNTTFEVDYRDGSKASQGENLHKVGRTTGWTYGDVVATCTNIEPGDAGIVNVCQNVVERQSNFSSDIADFGDSGSPVFDWAPNYHDDKDDVATRGILWGGNGDRSRYYYTPMHNVAFHSGMPEVDIKGNFGSDIFSISLSGPQNVTVGSGGTWSASSSGSSGSQVTYTWYWNGRYMKQETVSVGNGSSFSRGVFNSGPHTVRVEASSNGESDWKEQKVYTD